MSIQVPVFEAANDLATWIAEAAEISDPVATDRARDAFIDTVACILAGASDPAPSRVLQSVRSSGSGGCRVAGSEQTLSSEHAALVNGTAAHVLDFDDNFLPAVTHASAVLVPALLALGEEIGAAGDALLDAYIVGLEIQAWLGRRMIPHHYAAGWHATSTIGAVGAAAACARLLRLPKQGVSDALSIATSMAGGSKRQFGSMAKPLHAGLAARAGVVSARLAACGVRGDSDPFNGSWGFVELHGGGESDEEARPGPLSIVSDGLAQKRFPCCASAHRTLDAILDLRAEYDFAHADIEWIRTLVPESNFRNLRFDAPCDESEARFSMTYCASVAAIYGTLTLSDFTAMAVARLEVRRFMPRVQMRHSGARSDNSGIWDTPAITTIRLCDGSEIERAVSQPVGTISAPLSQRDLERKFADCAGRCLDAATAGRLLDRLRNLAREEAGCITALMTGGNEEPGRMPAAGK